MDSEGITPLEAEQGQQTFPEVGWLVGEANSAAKNPLVVEQGRWTLL